MNLTVALDNLNCLFKDNNGVPDTEINTECTIYRNTETGKVTEIRIWNQEYEEFIVLERTGRVQAVSVDEYSNK